MAKIFEMPPHLADLIAAGEVVERPGSVVKELVENSIDAGAGSVTVEIKNGGMSYIRVTDNGSGIAPEDTETAFLRHATSKLRDQRGLEAIGTLGFRGEALAAIAAVSRIELLTRERGTREGTRLTLEGGRVTGRAPAASPEGTSMVVRDLFFNTPARLKFMKNDRAEGSNVTAVVARLALSHPEISIKYVKDGREEYHTPGDGRLQSCVYSILGRDTAKSLLAAENVTDGITVKGYVSTPAGCRGNRSWQFFFVNGRFIKSRLLQTALEQAYKNSLFTGRYPVCVLELDMSYAAVDVNVHPTKMEVRFSDERHAFDAVYWAVRGALERESAPPELEISKGTLSAVRGAEEREAPVSGPADMEYSNHGPAGRSLGGATGGFRTRVPAVSESRSSLQVSEPHIAVYGQTHIDMPRVNPRTPQGEADGVPERGYAPGTGRDGSTVGLDMPTAAREHSKAPEDAARDPQARGYRFIGEALATYLIVERGDSIILIDKHAAHERVIFDTLRERGHEAASQVLLSPVICQVDEETARVIGENGELLSEFGFEIDDFGDGAVAIRQIPSDIDLGDGAALVEELAEKLRNGGRRDLESMRDGVMHTVACKAAIKAGRSSDPREVMGLIDKVMRGDVRYCPHGRPVSMELTRSQLDRGFKRA